MFIHKRYEDYIECNEKIYLSASPNQLHLANMVSLGDCNLIDGGSVTLLH